MYRDTLFINACASVTQLGLLLNLDKKANEKFKLYQKKCKSSGVSEVSPQQALKTMMNGIIKAWQQLELELPKGILLPKNIEYKGLKRLLKIDD